MKQRAEEGQSVPGRAGSIASARIDCRYGRSLPRGKNLSGAGGWRCADSRRHLCQRLPRSREANIANLAKSRPERGGGFTETPEPGRGDGNIGFTGRLDVRKCRTGCSVAYAVVPG